MKIILIAPIYFNYHQMIADALTKKGHSVDFFEDKHVGFLHTISNKAKFLDEWYQNNYQKKLFKKLTETNYDQMIVVGGKTLNATRWEKLHVEFPMKKVLYQWDSIQNFDYSKMMKSFDIVKTFDSSDAKKLQIPYLPLFFSQPPVYKGEQDVDLLFVGIWHSDRIEVLEQIVDFAKKYNLNHFVKIYYPKHLYLYLVHIKKHFSKSDLFIFEPVNPTEMNQLYNRSKCVIDINHPNQSGLTMRTIETVGSGKKLITTNEHIKNEVFYDPKMIQIIDRKNIQLDEAFFKSASSYTNIQQLEINNWVKELI